ncbi:hypothetical protein BES34_020175 [Leptospira inadai serovar Lyme]|uniref:Uncharacterized protein n=1 Tax=Leptospira inadai serovar Lyme TaxID=293084 RepID=A0ABX4YD98_9LEPT|nr:hypothetical protein BES34_020175 [Leptospira inadai serovar Lyme]
MRSEDRRRTRSLCSFRRPRTEDRRARFAHARQKLLDIEKVTEVEERSTITQESSHRTWNLRLSKFCPLKANYVGVPTQRTEGRRKIHC